MWKFNENGLEIIKDKKQRLIDDHDEVRHFQTVAAILSRYIRARNKSTKLIDDTIADLSRAASEYLKYSSIVDFVVTDFLLRYHDENSRTTMQVSTVCNERIDA